MEGKLSIGWEFSFLKIYLLVPERNGNNEILTQVQNYGNWSLDQSRLPRGKQTMSKRKTPLEIKSYYGGIYSYFKQQKLSKAKESKQTQSN